MGAQDTHDRGVKDDKDPNDSYVGPMYRSCRTSSSKSGINRSPFFTDTHQFAEAQVIFILTDMLANFRDPKHGSFVCKAWPSRILYD